MIRYKVKAHHCCSRKNSPAHKSHNRTQRRAEENASDDRRTRNCFCLPNIFSLGGRNPARETWHQVLSSAVLHHVLLLATKVPPSSLAKNEQRLPRRLSTSAIVGPTTSELPTLSLSLSSLGLHTFNNPKQHAPVERFLQRAASLDVERQVVEHLLSFLGEWYVHALNVSQPRMEPHLSKGKKEIHARREIHEDARTCQRTRGRSRG